MTGPEVSPPTGPGGEHVEQVRCTGTLGDKPSWMSWGQYDPCRCRLLAGHAPVEGGDDGHWCEHLSVPDPRLAASDSGRRPEDGT